MINLLKTTVKLTIISIFCITIIKSSLENINPYSFTTETNIENNVSQENITNDNSVTQTLNEVTQVPSSRWCAIYRCPFDSNCDGQCTFGDDNASREIVEGSCSNIVINGCMQIDEYLSREDAESGTNVQSFRVGDCQKLNCSITVTPSQLAGICNSDPATTDQICFNVPNNSKVVQDGVSGTCSGAPWCRFTPDQINCYKCSDSLFDGNTCEMFSHNGSSCPSGSTPSSICESAFGGSCPVNIDPKGFLDGATCLETVGWACDPNNFEEDLIIKLYYSIGESEEKFFLTETVANIQREEAVGIECGGNRNKGFQFNIPDELKNNTLYKIYAYALDADSGEEIELNQSPADLFCPVNTPTPTTTNTPTPTTTTVPSPIPTQTPIPTSTPVPFNSTEIYWYKVIDTEPVQPITNYIVHPFSGDLLISQVFDNNSVLDIGAIKSTPNTCSSVDVYNRTSNCHRVDGQFSELDEGRFLIQEVNIPLNLEFEWARCMENPFSPSGAIAVWGPRVSDNPLEFLAIGYPATAIGRQIINVNNNQRIYCIIHNKSISQVSPTPTITTTISPTITPSATTTPSPTSTVTPTTTPTATPSPTQTPTSTPTPTPSLSQIIQIGYNENNGNGDTGAQPRPNTEIGCVGGTTEINGVSVHWIYNGNEPNIKYQRQFTVGDNENWMGNEIYTNQYTNFRTFNGNPGQPGIYKSRVRAFVDLNNNNQLDTNEMRSEWSNICQIRFVRNLNTVETGSLEVCKENQQGDRLSGWEINLRRNGVNLSGNQINLSNPNGSNVSIPAGIYRISVSGTYRYGNSQMIADAGYSYRPIGIPDGCNCWFDGNQLYIPKALKLQINNQNIEWGVFNASHSYSTIYNHTGGELNFSVIDNNYSDNTNIDMVITIEGLNQTNTTSVENGCVNFENLLPGEYFLSENIISGWQFISRSDGRGNGELINILPTNNGRIIFTNQNISPTITPTATATPTPIPINYIPFGQEVYETYSQDGRDGIPACIETDHVYTAQDVNGRSRQVLEWVPVNGAESYFIRSFRWNGSAWIPTSGGFSISATPNYTQKGYNLTRFNDLTNFQRYTELDLTHNIFRYITLGTPEGTYTRYIAAYSGANATGSLIAESQNIVPDNRNNYEVCSKLTIRRINTTPTPTITITTTPTATVTPTPTTTVTTIPTITASITPSITITTSPAPTTTIIPTNTPSPTTNPNPTPTFIPNRFPIVSLEGNGPAENVNGGILVTENTSFTIKASLVQEGNPNYVYEFFSGDDTCSGTIVNSPETEFNSNIVNLLRGNYECSVRVIDIDNDISIATINITVVPSTDSENTGRVLGNDTLQNCNENELVEIRGYVYIDKNTNKILDIDSDEFIKDAQIVISVYTRNLNAEEILIEVDRPTTDSLGKYLSKLCPTNKYKIEFINQLNRQDIELKSESFYNLFLNKGFDRDLNFRFEFTGFNWLLILLICCPILLILFLSYGILKWVISSRSENTEVQS